MLLDIFFIFADMNFWNYSLIIYFPLSFSSSIPSHIPVPFLPSNAWSLYPLIVISDDSNYNLCILNNLENWEKLELEVMAFSMEKYSNLVSFSVLNGHLRKIFIFFK